MRATLVATALLWGCSFDASVDPNVTIINCTQNSDCPEGFDCNRPAQPGEVSRCQRRGAEVDVLGPFGLRNPAGAVAVFATYTFVYRGTDSKPFTHGTVWADSNGNGAHLVFDTQPLDDGGFEARYQVSSDAGADPDGLYFLTAAFWDDTGSGQRTQTPWIIDRRPPQLTSQDPLVITPSPVSAGAIRLLPATALGAGGTVLVGFGADEEVTSTLYARAPASDAGSIGALSFTSTSGQGLGHTFVGTLSDAGVPQGEVELVAVLTDLAGNVAEVPLSHRLVLDTIAPVLDTTGDRTFFQTHAPFGAADGGTPHTLSVKASQFPEEGTLLVMDLTGVVGRTAVTPGVRVDSLVLQADGPYTVTLIDAAGNGSEPQPVRDGTIIYRPNGSGPDISDGRTLEEWPATVGARHGQPLIRTTFGPAGKTIFSRGAWQHRSDDDVVPVNAPMACDADRGQIIRYGGSARGIKMADTYLWDGAGWRSVVSSGVLPPASADDARLVYDTDRQRTVMFHGPTGETYVWDGQLWGLQPSLPPPRRTNFSMAFDERAAKMVLFGGVALDGGLLGDTWLWDGTTWDSWDGGVGPRPRKNAAMAFDPVQQTLLLYGGSGVSSGIDEVWTFGSPTGWQKLTVAPGDHPDASMPMMMHDVRRALMRVIAVAPTEIENYKLLFPDDGGLPFWDHDFDSGFAASSAQPADVFSAVYDSTRSEAFMTDGHWRMQLPPARNWKVGYWVDVMSPEAAPALAWDEVGQQVLMFGGGGGGANAAASDELWAWKSDGGGWSPVAQAIKPRARSGAALLPVDGGLLLAGGKPGGISMPGTSIESYLWQPASDGTGQWLTLPTNFIARTSGASNGDVAILWGRDAGYYAGGDVHPAVTNGQLQAAFAAMAYDPITRWIIAHDGVTTWTSAALQASPPTPIVWTSVAAQPAAPPRGGPSLWYDERLQRVLMFGGVATPFDTRVYAWNGTGWDVLPVADLEGDHLPSAGGSIAYDRVNGAAVLWRDDSTETWTLRYADQRPMLAFHNRLVTQLHVASLDQIALGRIRVSAIAGGDGTEPGAKLLIWSQGRWESSLKVEQNDAGTAAPALTTLSVLDIGRVEQLLRGHGELSIAVTTVGGHGLTPAKLTVQELEVSLDYKVVTP